MKFYISYFYAVRFMKPNTVALSTAMWDPKWFYNKHQGDVYLDKREVLNGLRAEPFVPKDHQEGEGYCGNCDHDNSKCHFMQHYREQLDALDFIDMMRRFESIAQRVVTNGEEPEIVLLVHEAPTNPCSERWALFDWFRKHGIEVDEYPIPEKKKPKRKFDF